MAVITQTIQPGERRNEVTEIQKALISLGANIAPAEIFTPTTAGTYGPTTQAAIAALLPRFGLVQPGPHLQCYSGKVIEHRGRGGNGQQRGAATSCARILRGETDRTGCRSIELAWHARYAVMARDFTTAKKIATLIPNEPAHQEKEDWSNSQTEHLTASAPEILNPENYYTVLYDYVPRSTIKAFVSGT